MTKKAIQGVMSITASGYGYVSSDELEEDVKIDPLFLNTALHKDEVEILLYPQKKGDKPQGEVLKVLKRNKTKFVGTIERKKGQRFAFLIPDDERMYMDIFIPDSKVKDGSKVFVEIVSWESNKKNPQGKVLKVIGRKGDNDAEINSIVLEKGLSIEFPPEVEEEASKLTTFNNEERRDFRGVTTFTIDPKDAKDFDDAISVKELDGGDYEVGVHIADVSYYVKEDTALDEEARKRAFSIYLVDRTIPMLPEVLSNNICSLMPKKDRLAFSAVFKLDKKGRVKEKWFGETIICSDQRFTYKEAQKILDDKSGKFFKELSFLAEVAKSLREERVQRGAVDFDDSEVQFELDQRGIPLFIYKKEKLFVHKLIEEFMVLANREVATNFGELYRVHETPKKSSIEGLVSFLSKIGYKIKVEGNTITSNELNDLFARLKGKKEEFLVKSVVLQSMSKAVYATKNKKHFGLALDKYTHFTSPIRRYPDLMIHRVVKKKLKGESIKKDYSKVAMEISLRELDVLSAERDSVAYKQVQYMMEWVEEKFEAIISGVTRFGVFVRITDNYAEGLVSIRNMEDDYYVLDEETYSLIGTKKNKRYSLGDVVKVKLIGGSVETRRLEFVFA